MSRKTKNQKQATTLGSSKLYVACPAVVKHLAGAMVLSFYSTANKTIQLFLGIIDHGSRKALTLQTLINKSSWTLLGYLCLAIGKYGKPKKLRTDNEVIFTSFVFRTFLKLVNIQHQRIPTASPW